jgi:hypothetical protein
MDAASLAQFSRILAIAIGFLIAAPIVVFLAESAEHPRERPRRVRAWRWAPMPP